MLHEVICISFNFQKLCIDLIHSVSIFFSSCQSIDSLLVLEQIKFKLENVSDRIRSIRILLLLESYLRTNLIKAKHYKDSLVPILNENIKNCDHPDVVSKMKKVLFIISKK